jgi:hypothetical protein
MDAEKRSTMPKCIWSSTHSFYLQRKNLRSSWICITCTYVSCGTPASYVKKAQKVLMSRLGICEIEGEAPVDCLDRYARFFREPLPASRVEALAKLFFLESAAMVPGTEL